MRNRTLDQIIDDVRLETGRSSKPNLGTGEKPAIVRMINRVYEKLYIDHDWDHLKIERYLSAQAGQRYYDMPNDLDFERILRAEFKYGDRWDPIKRGITRDDIDIHNSEVNTNRSDPIWKWQILLPEGETKEQLEAWPIPASNGTNNIYFKGILKFEPLVEGNDKCLLDNNLIALYAAGEMLARGNKQDAAIKLREGKDLYNTLKKRGANQFPNRLNRNGNDPYGDNSGNRGRVGEIHVAHVEG